MIPQAKNAITPLIVLTKGIQAIIWRLNEAESHHNHNTSCIWYSYSDEAERILRLQIYHNQFMHSAIAYLNAFDANEINNRPARIFDYRERLRLDTNVERHCISNTDKNHQ